MACRLPSIVSYRTLSPPSFNDPSSSSSLPSSQTLNPGHLKRLRLFSFRPPKAIQRCVASEGNDDTVERFSGRNAISDFLRFKRDDEDGSAGELQTAVVSYRKRFPWTILHPFLQVDLVSTIHIADKEYFEILQKGLEQYDCVLYEMVASRDSLENRKNSSTTKHLKSLRTKGFNILGFIQRQMALALALDFQLDCLDYEGESWVHADLDYETFKFLQHEKSESFFTFARDMTLKSTKALMQSASISEDLDPWRSKLLWASRVVPMPLIGLLIIGSVCTPAEGKSIPELEALYKLDFRAAIKIFLARRLTSEFTQITSSVEEESVIIGERNRVAMDELRRAVESGYSRIAVLYGGGHMPDMSRRLCKELDMAPWQVEWVTAWSIRPWDLEIDSLPILKRLARASGWPLNRYQTLALLIVAAVLGIDLFFWELFFGSMASSAAWCALQLDMIAHRI